MTEKQSQVGRFDDQPTMGRFTLNRLYAVLLEAQSDNNQSNTLRILRFPSLLAQGVFWLNLYLFVGVPELAVVEFKALFDEPNHSVKENDAT